jgi:phospholipid transport system substrate-binding protein
MMNINVVGFKSLARFASAITLLIAFVAPTSFAATAPQVLVEDITKQLFASAKANNAATKKSDAYVAEVQKILEGVVDFPFIAKNVMRKSAPDAKPEQIEKFTQVFKTGLIQTYAKGIANYADSEVKTLPVVPGKKPTRVSVDQDVTNKGATHKLSYTFEQNAAGDWKLINVVLNGVNLGQSFTSQFDEAMLKQGKDLDKVIANWLAVN